MNIGSENAIIYRMTREEFKKVYANIPLNLREEIILVLKDRGPITWNVAYLEIEQSTELGKEILKKLDSIWGKEKEK